MKRAAARSGFSCDIKYYAKQVYYYSYRKRIYSYTCYSDFGLFYQVPQNAGPLYYVMNTIDTYVYRGFLELGDINMSAAAGLYQSVAGFVLVFGSNMLVHRIDPDNALFMAVLGILPIVIIYLFIHESFYNSQIMKKK